MPLPDERPRQSVANLIGRFEKQKSSASSSAPPVSFPRTSSVASHRTDDSAQEEIREKREWPPKSLATSVSPPTQLSENRSTPTPLVSPTSNERPVLSGPERPSPPAVSENLSPSLPQLTPSQSTPTKAKSPPPNQSTPAKVKSPPPSQIKPASTRAPTSVKPTAPKATVPEASLKRQSSGGSTLPSSTPLKSQHTGQSTTSTHTAGRVSAKPRVSAPAQTSAVTTPARSKTPLSTMRPKTPSTAPRVTTPLSNARSKTPSGLYAPTAASLARSKGGAPAPPPPEKPKRKVTTDLSKPTAASASRMRSPAAVPAAKAGKTPAGRPKIAAKGTSTLAKRPAVAKPGSKESAIGKTDVDKSDSGAVAVATVAGATTVTAASVAVADESDGSQPLDVAGAVVSDSGDLIEGSPEEVDHSADAHEDSAADEAHLQSEEEQPISPDDSEIENYDEDFPDDTLHEPLEESENGHAMAPEMDSGSVAEEVEEHIAGPINSPQHDDVLLVSQGHHDSEPSVQESPQGTPEAHGVVSQLHHTEDIVDHEPIGGQPEEVAKGSKVGSDLEDIVNLLELGPQSQRPSVESSPAEGAVSDTGEIPDEY